MEIGGLFWGVLRSIKVFIISKIEMPRSKSPVKKYIAKPATVAPSPTAPSSVYHHHNVEVERPGFFSNMWQGFGLGAGQAIAHNVFRKEPEVKVVHEHTPVGTSATTSTSVVLPPAKAGSMDTTNVVSVPKDYTQCLKDNSNDKELCKQFLG